MTTVAFDDQIFRQQYPEFVNPDTYPPAMLNNWFTMASQYINPNSDAYRSLDVVTLMLNLMVAHLAKSMTMIAAGQTTAVVTGATEGSVTVSMEPPPTKNAFQWWLSTTPYGAQLRALLFQQGVGGFAVGGSLERSAFRKANGIF